MNLRQATLTFTATMTGWALLSANFLAKTKFMAELSLVIVIKDVGFVVDDLDTFVQPVGLTQYVSNVLKKSTTNLIKMYKIEILSAEHINNIVL